MDIEELKTAMKEDKDVQAFIKTIVDPAVDEATKGLKDTNKQLKSEKTKIQGILDKMPTSEELENYKKMSAVIDSSEDAKLIADGKIDEVIERRTERVRLDFESKNATLQEELDKTKGELGTVNSSFDTHRINEAIRAESLKQGVAPEAIEDVVLRSTGIFSIGEDKKIVSLDSEGHVVTDDKGTPLDIPLFIANLKEKAPHFWPGSKGAGLGGSGDEITDSLLVAAEKGNTSGYVDGRRAQKKKAREAHLK